MKNIHKDALWILWTRDSFRDKSLFGITDPFGSDALQGHWGLQRRWLRGLCLWLKGLIPNSARLYSRYKLPSTQLDRGPAKEQKSFSRIHSHPVVLHIRRLLWGITDFFYEFCVQLSTDVLPNEKSIVCEDTVGKIKMSQSESVYATRKHHSQNRSVSLVDRWMPKLPHNVRSKICQDTTTETEKRAPPLRGRTTFMCGLLTSSYVLRAVEKISCSRNFSVEVFYTVTQTRPRDSRKIAVQYAPRYRFSHPWTNNFQWAGANCESNYGNDNLTFTLCCVSYSVVSCSVTGELGSTFRPKNEPSSRLLHQQPKHVSESVPCFVSKGNLFNRVKSSSYVETNFLFSAKHQKADLW